MIVGVVVISVVVVVGVAIIDFFCRRRIHWCCYQRRSDVQVVLDHRSARKSRFGDFQTGVPDGRTDGQTDPFIEMRSHIYKNSGLIFGRFH